MEKKGYMIFDSEWMNDGFKFEVGKAYEMPWQPICGRQGFHYWESLNQYYVSHSFDPSQKIAEVEALGAIDGHEGRCCTNIIEVVREITWGELMTIVNTGMANSGFGNSGNYNTGGRNSGSHNAGKNNSGDWNCGNFNSGRSNVGSYNSGSYNSGDSNSGNGNSGIGNSGSYNSGNSNKGNYNSGSFNTGNYNTGDWNKTNFASGCFNTVPGEGTLFFNKPSEWSFKDWEVSKAEKVMRRCPVDEVLWVKAESMTDEEKEQHPEYEVTGGFLKEFEAKSRQEWWDELAGRDQSVVVSLPNFDEAVFEEITGIKAN